MSKSRSRSRTKKTAPAPAKKGGSGRLRQPCMYYCRIVQLVHTIYLPHFSFNLNFSLSCFILSFHNIGTWKLHIVASAKFQCRLIYCISGRIFTNTRLQIFSAAQTLQARYSEARWHVSREDHTWHHSPHEVGGPLMAGSGSLMARCGSKRSLKTWSTRSPSCTLKDFCPLSSTRKGPW